MDSLAAKIRKKLGASHYRMAKLLQRTQRGYTILEESGQKYRLRDIIVLKIVSGLNWEQFGDLIEESMEEDG
jgi:hypothetical protein